MLRALSKRGRPVSFRPDATVELWLDLAQKAGLDKTEIVNTTLLMKADNKAFPGVSSIEMVVRSMMKMKQRKLQEIAAEFSDLSPTAKLVARVG